MSVDRMADERMTVSATSVERVDPTGSPSAESTSYHSEDTVRRLPVGGRYVR